MMAILGRNHHGSHVLVISQLRQRVLVFDGIQYGFYSFSMAISCTPTQCSHTIIVLQLKEHVTFVE